MEKKMRRGEKRKMGSQSAEQKKGILYAAGAYTMWGNPTDLLEMG